MLLRQASESERLLCPVETPHLALMQGARKRQSGFSNPDRSDSEAQSHIMTGMSSALLGRKEKQSQRPQRPLLYLQFLNFYAHALSVPYKPQHTGRTWSLFSLLHGPGWSVLL